MVLFYCLFYVRSFLIKLFAIENTTVREEPWPRGPPLDLPPDPTANSWAYGRQSCIFPSLCLTLIYKVYGLVSSKAEKFT